MSETAAFRGWKAQGAIEWFLGIARLVSNPFSFRAARTTGRRDDRVPFRRTDQQEITGINRHTEMLDAAADTLSE
jgi:hypothetical protein